MALEISNVGQIGHVHFLSRRAFRRFLPNLMKMFVANVIMNVDK